MANTLKLKRSAAAGVVPTTAQLQLGELAINTYDGRLFTKKNNGTDSVIEFVSNSGTWGISITGSAATLTTARTINGTSFNGSANITTANWGTGRTLTIGNTGKSVDGSGNVAWSLGEIGALPVAGGVVSGVIVSTVATGTAPLQVSSTTRVANLNAATAGNADTVGNKAIGSSGNTIPLLDQVNAWSAKQTFSAGLVLGATGGYPDRHVMIDFASDVAGTWRKLADIVAPTGTYSTLLFKVDVVDPQANHGVAHSVGTVQTETYYVACCRTESTTQDTPDACYVSGPSDLIRAVKTDTGTYEIQIKNRAQYREYRVALSVITFNGAHTVTYSDGGTASTGIAQYAASVSPTAQAVFQNVSARQYISTVATGTAPLSVTSTTGCPNLNADMVDGKHVGSSGNTLPLLDQVNTWGARQISSLAGTALHWSLYNAGSGSTAHWATNATNVLLLLSDGTTGPTDTWNSLRPFSVDVATGAVTMSNGVTIGGGLTVSNGGAAVTGGFTAYNNTNDYTQATVKFGRSSGAHIALHGGSSGNFLTHVASDANLDPFQIDIKTETKSWRHQFAVSDGFLIPGQGIRWGTGVGNDLPTTTTRSAGTRMVLYPSLSDTLVDYALGYTGYTFWSSIATNASSRCFKWFAGTTPIAALGGDGTPFVYQAAEATQDTTATLTATQMRNGIITSTPTAAITLTLPTGANMNNTLWDTDTAMDWTLINLATDGTKTVTLSSNTNHAITGDAVVAINSSARFRTRKTPFEQNGNPTFVTYRIS